MKPGRERQTDPYERLALRIKDLATKTVKKHAGSSMRFIVLRVDPLRAEAEDGTVIIEEDDDDVEIFRPVLRLRDDDELDVDDVLQVRETADGYEIWGVVA